MVRALLVDSSSLEACGFVRKPLIEQRWPVIFRHDFSFGSKPSNRLESLSTNAAPRGHVRKALHLSWFYESLSHRQIHHEGCCVDHRSTARTSVPDLQLGIWVDGSVGWAQCQDQKERVHISAGNNRMNSVPDRSFAPAPASALRDLAVLFEYSEGPHEANARQRNPRRGVARSTG